MARTKRFTVDELLDMPEERRNGLYESGYMDDDDWQRWQDLRDECALSSWELEELANLFG